MPLRAWAAAPSAATLRAAAGVSRAPLLALPPHTSPGWVHYTTFHQICIVFSCADPPPKAAEGALAAARDSRARAFLQAYQAIPVAPIPLRPLDDTCAPLARPQNATLVPTGCGDGAREAWGARAAWGAASWAPAVACAQVRECLCQSRWAD